MPSIMQRIGTPNNRHNKDVKYRAQLENVDPSLSKYNNKLRSKSVEEIYNEFLQPAFEEFNNKQKRRDRRLDVKWNCSTYLEYQRAIDRQARNSKNNIKQKGRPPVREIVWQFGNPEQGYGCRNQTDEHRTLVEEMLFECQEEAENRYRNFAWGDADFHADEVSFDAEEKEHGSLHLHSSFVPLCFENKQGPAVQVAFERALKEMGFNTFQEWKHDLDNIMETVLERHGLQREDMNNNNLHQESKEFHRQQRLIKQTRELEKQKTAIESEIESITEKGKKYIEEYKEEFREIEREIVQMEDTRYIVLNEMNSLIENSAETLNELVEQTVDCALENSNGVYNNALFYMAACSDDEFENISEKGYKLKKQIMYENIDMGQLQSGLDAVIKTIENNSVQISWEERQRFWEIWKELTGAYWKELPELQKSLKIQIGEEYDRRREALKSFYNAQYMMRRTRSLLVLIIFAIIGFRATDKQKEAEQKIAQLKQERQLLISNTSSFKKYSNYVRDELKAGREPCERYLKTMNLLLKTIDENQNERRNVNKKERSLSREDR